MLCHPSHARGVTSFPFFHPIFQELDLLDDEARVFKLIGPVLMKQPLKEAKDTVENRIKYLNEEIKRQDGLVKDIEKKQEQQREQIRQIQQKMQASSSAS